MKPMDTSKMSEEEMLRLLAIKARRGLIDKSWAYTINYIFGYDGENNNKNTSKNTHKTH